jgi:hypothetical protein
MQPNLLNYITTETSTSPTDMGPIPAKEVKLISNGDPHFVSINGSTATFTSFLVPQGVAMDVTIPFNTTLSVRCHTGQGHFTVAY